MLDFIITTSSVLVPNEWAKLAATFCNSSAVAAFVGGVIAPMFSEHLVEEGWDLAFRNDRRSSVSLHRTSFPKHAALSCIRYVPRYATVTRRPARPRCQRSQSRGGGSSNVIEIARVKITEAGRKALAAAER
jgi:hypothetical protein